jgi:hypothetical protein
LTTTKSSHYPASKSITRIPKKFASAKANRTNNPEPKFDPIPLETSAKIANQQTITEQIAQLRRKLQEIQDENKRLHAVSPATQKGANHRNKEAQIRDATSDAPPGR